MKKRELILGFFLGCLYLLLMYNRVFLKNQSSSIGIFFLNTMPNFFAGFFFTLLLSQINFKKSTNTPFISSMIIGLWLTLEEFSPIFSHNIYFDYNDILMSWIGAFLGMFIEYKLGNKPCSKQ